jgi:hypothetical protein
LSNRYKPSDVVTVVLTMPVSVLVAVTVVSATDAPLGSSTRPVMVANEALCANVVWAFINAKSIKAKMDTLAHSNFETLRFMWSLPSESES